MFKGLIFIILNESDASPRITNHILNENGITNISGAIVISATIIYTNTGEHNGAEILTQFSYKSAGNYLTYISAIFIHNYNFNKYEVLAGETVRIFYININ